MSETQGGTPESGATTAAAPANPLPSPTYAPGTLLREYETIFILRSDTEQEGIGKVNTRVRGIVEKMQGKLIKVDNWGKRKLAYEIEKQLKGIYVYFRYLGASGLVEEIERNLRLLDVCIKYQTVRVDEDIDPNARPSEVSEEAFAAAANAAEAEDEMELERLGHGRGLGPDADDDDDRDVVAKDVVVPEIDAPEPAEKDEE
jgi:small subunit ribosomal protein S6